MSRATRDAVTWAKSGGREPLAIVGIGCRFPPAADSPRALWENLCEGVDGIRDVPADRWDVRKFYDPDPSKPGKMYVRQAGFLRQPFQLFDAPFFGMSPREASRMDPQQRLLLEVAYESFEDAGIPLGQMSGSKTGVFVGGFMLDALISGLSRDNRNVIALHTGVGTTMTALSARLSYLFDLRGPTLTMDTACSSSLVATHYAVQSI
jgi:acyl transferase domain-containing protein